MSVANDMQKPSGTFNDSTTEAQIYQMLVASGGNTSAAARIAAEVNSGQRSMANVEYHLAQAGGGGGGYTSSGSSSGSSSGTAGQYTEADVAALFKRYNVPIHSPTETETQRLQRLTFQLNSGTRTMDDIEYWVKETAKEIAAGTHWSVTGDTSGFGVGISPGMGGAGAANLQETTGANGQIWLDTSTGIWYMAFTYPGTDAWLVYKATEAQLAGELGLQVGGVTPDRRLGAGDLDRLGAIHAGAFGDVQTIDPFRHMIDQLTLEMGLAPWLGDPDFLALTLEAWLEGREITDAELASTQWFQSHNDAQRQWMILYNSDPMSAAQRLDSNVISIRQTLISMGSADPPPSMVQFMATQVTQGNWSQSKLQEQMLAVSDPASGIAIDPALKAAIGAQDVDTTQKYEDEVRELALTWLGPQFGVWSEGQIRHWAGRMRNDPDAKIHLEEMLRSQRMSLFPEYENSLLTYEDIAAPWRNVYSQLWGQNADETDSFFYDIIRTNDVVSARSMLTQEGLKRGVEKVENDFLSGLLGVTGGTVRRAY